MSDVQTRFSDGAGNKRPAVWKDRKGVVHSAVGAEIHRGIRLMWTACGKKDIPANAAWIMEAGDAVTCPDCKMAELLEALEKIANGDGAYGAQAHEYKQIARAAIVKARGQE